MSKPLLMLVDDSAEMGVIVACLGKRADWEVQVCLDAETAWVALAQRRPDLVLLDVNLPGASGPEWLRRVRATPDFTGLPVALYTHWGLANDVATGLDAGAEEDVVLDDRAAGHVDPGLDQDPRPDPDAEIDAGSPPDDAALPDRGTLADL